MKARASGKPLMNKEISNQNRKAYQNQTRLKYGASARKFTEVIPHASLALTLMSSAPPAQVATLDPSKAAMFKDFKFSFQLGDRTIYTDEQIYVWYCAPCSYNLNIECYGVYASTCSGTSMLFAHCARTAEGARQIGLKWLVNIYANYQK